METRDLTVPDPQTTFGARLAESSSASGLPYTELQRIAQLFAEEHLRTGQTLPAPHPLVAPETARALPDEQYLDRVRDLIAQEARLLRMRAAPAQEAQCPALTHSAPPRPERATAPAFVWKYSAITLSTGGGIALAGYGVGAAAPGLSVLDDVLAAAGQVVMGVTALVVVLCLALCAKPSQKAASGTVVSIGKAVFKRNRFNG
ncbi:hypothetical protein ACGRHY_27895 [Streptomyces sp. HK10]|uniref:hypothetical protein n=1 Tax=Streptomyces sp. HK10 TaxID=3373255 RepID=UPI00374A3D29